MFTARYELNLSLKFRLNFVFKGISLGHTFVLNIFFGAVASFYKFGEIYVRLAVGIYEWFYFRLNARRELI